MKTFGLLELATRDFLETAIRKFGGDPDKFRHLSHPQEDYFLISKKYPILVVADGVTLIQNIIDNTGQYPNPSPAGEAARLFCEAALREAEDRYEAFKEQDIRAVFEAGNRAVGDYNQAAGRTKETVDYWTNDFYAITAALGVVKDGQVFWGSICDSYVAHFSKTGELLFRSPDCRALAQTPAPKFSGNPNDLKSRTEYVWRVFRNRLNKKGERVGYGVITGEPTALNYLSSGSLLLGAGELIMILTDGFEHYLELPEFIALFKNWPADLEDQIKKFTAGKAQENPDKFGHERTLLVAHLK